VKLCHQKDFTLPLPSPPTHWLAISREKETLDWTGGDKRTAARTVAQELGDRA